MWYSQIKTTIQVNIFCDAELMTQGFLSLFLHKTWGNHHGNITTILLGWKCYFIKEIYFIYNLMLKYKKFEILLWLQIYEH